MGKDGSNWFSMGPCDSRSLLMILDGYGPPGANLLHFLIEFYSEMKHLGAGVEAGAARSKFASFLNRILLRNETVWSGGGGRGRPEQICFIS